MATSTSAAKTVPMKRLVVCCDGTWMDANAGTQISLDPLKVLAAELTGKVSLQTPTNVTRIGRCVKPLDDRKETPIQQITYYQAGIGSRNLEDKILGGATGFGLAEHIREAYQFIASNYNRLAHDVDGDGVPGDEIYLIGFSRGAFTARSIAAFINDVGLLTPLGMTHFYTIFVDWENQLKKNWKAPFPKDPFDGHELPEYNMSEKTGKKKYVDKLLEQKFTIPGVKIKACAVFDTVGSLGVPRLGIFNKLNHESLDYAFVDTSVPECVMNAIHALALDEDRKPFMPTIWELPDKVRQPGQTLTQVWFAGGHADVGGSYDDTRAADITLAWMVSQLAALGIDFDYDIMAEQFFKPDGNAPTIPWGCGPIHNSYKGIYLLADDLTRSPMEYLRYDHDTGVPRVPHEPLENTYEKVHSSVRIRWGSNGKDHEGKPYASPALKGWKVEGTVEPTSFDENKLDVGTIDKVETGIVWRNGTKVMHEDAVSKLEWDLIRTFRPDIAGKFLSIAPKL